MTSLLRPTQVAELLQVEERTVTRWLRDGYMRGYKLGKEWRIDSTELESFVERNVNKRLDSFSPAEHQSSNGEKIPI